jgi:hypothetical protein
MRIVYIAGRYSGASRTQVAYNIDEARKVALMLAERRIFFICSHTMTAHFETLLGDNDPGYEHWIAQSLALLARCNAVLALPGWQHSNGAKREVEYARAYSIPVFEHIEALAHWIAGA